MPTQGRRRKLLLADDSPTVQKVVSLTFADEGLEVVSVSTGAEALAEIEREVPDIFLADVHMPAPGGYEVCARVKRSERTRRVPVVLLVGAFEPFDQAEARRCGADEVLTKPFQSIRELVNKVGVLLGAQPEVKSPDSGVDETDATGEPRPTSTAVESRAARARAQATEARDVRASDAEAARAGRAESSPAPAFADLDFDDADIEAATPEEFAARSREQREPAEAAAEFAAS
ncbi:MAG: PleD family two-component system response regulator, partial [Pyrinomonadaceae bacterium]